MKPVLRNFLQLLLLGAVVGILIRFFPLVIRLTEAAAMSLRAFWWVALIFGLGAWLIWVLRNRNS